MSDEKPPMPPGMPAMPPMPPMPPAPPADGAPPAPPGLPPMPPMPSMDAPPAPPGMPPMPPMPAMDAPPAPPGMPAMPPMDAPPAPPGLPPMPPMPEMEAPPAPPMPEMDAPPAPPGMPPMPPMPEMEAPPAPPMPEMDAPPAPPGMPPMPPMAADPLAPPMEAPVDPLMAPPMPPMAADPLAPPMEAPVDPLMAPPMPPMADDPLAPPMEAPADPLMAPLTPPMAEDPLAPPMDAPVDPLMAPLGDVDPLSPPAEDPLAAPMDLTGEQAGATIRSSAEVDGIIGDKLEGTLHEIEKSTLTSDGEIVKQTVKGTLTVNNPSAEDRIYDIDVLLDHADATDIGGDHVSVDELEAGKNYSMKYKVDGKRMLVLRERLDTNPARTSARSLSVACNDEGGPIALELEVENVASVAIHEVVVVRPLPEEMSFSHAPGAEIENNNLTWNVGALGAGEKRSLMIEGTIMVTGTDKIDAGAATASYTADSTLSSLNFRELDAFCRGFSYMRVREDERPDNWLCKTTFENRSSFAVDLVKLQVRMKGSEDLLFDIKDVKEDVPPHGKWESEERTVMAQSKPDFATDLSYTILPRASRSTEGSLTLQSSTLEVVEASLEKSYSTGSLRSYRPQKLTACLTFTNNGSANINVVRFTDDVPGLFEAPDLESFTVKVDGKDIADNQFKSEITEGITLEKENRSPDGLGYTMTTMVGIVAPIGLKPGKSLTIEYDLSAPDPTPENNAVRAPAHCEFSAEKAGPRCGRDALDAPTISVVHNRRDFSAGKQTLPVGGKGRYEVLILFENNGDTALQDVYINDVMPANFEITDWHIRGAGGDKRTDCKMSTEEGEGGTHISWMVPLVGKGERLDVFMEIKGSGQIDAEALNRFHGVHFGDEVESEDLPATPEPEAETEEEAEENTEVEADEAESEADATEDSEDTPKVTWREDVLLRVMEASGIDVAERDAFVEHAANFDLDENGYLKKAELEAAAEAWSTESSEDEAEEAEDETTAEEAPAEEAPAEEEAAEEEESIDDKMCPICMTMNAHDATECSSCKYDFTS